MRVRDAIPPERSDVTINAVVIDDDGEVFVERASNGTAVPRDTPQ